MNHIFLYYVLLKSFRFIKIKKNYSRLISVNTIYYKINGFIDRMRVYQHRRCHQVYTTMY